MQFQLLAARLRGDRGWLLLVTGFLPSCKLAPAHLSNFDAKLETPTILLVTSGVGGEIGCVALEPTGGVLGRSITVNPDRKWYEFKPLQPNIVNRASKYVAGEKFLAGRRREAPAWQQP